MPTQQIIIRLIIEGEILDSDDLIKVADHHGLAGLKSFLQREKLPAQRIVRHIPVRQLLERERRALRTKFPPLHSLTHYWRLEATGMADARGFATDLGRLTSEISLAYVEARVEPMHLLATPANNRSGNTHLDPGPVGIDAYSAWSKSNGKGEDVSVIDLETGWILTHTDLPGPQLLFNDNESNQHKQRDHGAAVMGIIGAKDNGTGVTGIAPNLAFLNAVSHYEQATHTRYHVTAAIAEAISHLRAGDILLLEVVRYPGNGSDDYPTEIDAADHDAIRSAVAAGIVVIEAAGNSDLNLNGTVLNPVDSGAILVGAGKSAVSGSPDGHEREIDSNFGDRVDCYAWGDSIGTAGYGDKAGLEGGDDSYTEQFSQTSGASAIIAGAATVVQSWVKARCIKPLTSTQMRSVLSNPNTGTPQSNISISPPDPIGVMPDLKKILTWWLWVRVVLWCLRGRLRRVLAIIYRPKSRPEFQK